MGKRTVPIAAYRYYHPIHIPCQYQADQCIKS